MVKSLNHDFKNIPKNKLRSFKAKINNWYKLNKREFPWRSTRNPYEILVAEMLLQQTDVTKALTAYKTFLNKYPNIISLNNSSLYELKNIFLKIGLTYRAKRFKEIAQIISDEYNGDIPESPARLLTLPGVGRYIANAVSSTAFNRRLEILDTNFIRIFERFFGIKSNQKRPRNDNMLWSFANSLLPRKNKNIKLWNWAVLDFGSVVCTNYNPCCTNCTLAKKCNYYLSNINTH